MALAPHLLARAVQLDPVGREPRASALRPGPSAPRRPSAARVPPRVELHRPGGVARAAVGDHPHVALELHVLAGRPCAKPSSPARPPRGVSVPRCGRRRGPARRGPAVPKAISICGAVRRRPGSQSSAGAPGQRQRLRLAGGVEGQMLSSPEYWRSTPPRRPRGAAALAARGSPARFRCRAPTRCGRRRAGLDRQVVGRITVSGSATAVDIFELEDARIAPEDPARRQLRETRRVRPAAGRPRSGRRAERPSRAGRSARRARSGRSSPG